jgi:hypothetical protein
MNLTVNVERLWRIEREFPEALLLAFDKKQHGPLGKLAEEYCEIKRLIKEYFLDSPAALLPDDDSRSLRTTIQKILLGKKLPLEEALVGTPLERLFGDEHTFDELDELAANHFFSWFSQYEYVNGLLEVGALIARIDATPDELDCFLQEMRRSYAFQQYLAVCVLCRTVIEIALRHLCQLEGYFDPEHQNYAITRAYLDRKAREQERDFRIPEDYQMQPADLRALLARSNHFVRFREPIADLYVDLSRIVHGNRTVSKIQALGFAQGTLKLLHDLYEV